MSSVEKFTRLKKQVVRVQREADKAQGALDEIMKRLRKEFGSKTLVEAEKLLKRFTKEEKELERQFTKDFRSFEKKWRRFLQS